MKVTARTLRQNFTIYVFSDSKYMKEKPRQVKQASFFAPHKGRHPKWNNFHKHRPTWKCCMIRTSHVVQLPPFIVVVSLEVISSSSILSVHFFFFCCCYCAFLVFFCERGKRKTVLIVMNSSVSKKERTQRYLMFVLFPPSVSSIIFFSVFRLL